jgi:hypothetical protein
MWVAAAPSWAALWTLRLPAPGLTWWVGAWGGGTASAEQRSACAVRSAYLAVPFLIISLTGSNLVMHAT